MKKITNPTITTPKGFSAGAVYAGIKSKKKNDLMILTSGGNCVCSAAFTKNTVKAAPVLISKKNLDKTKGAVRALMVNSGNANAVTGPQGMKDTEDILKYIASKLGIKKDEVLMCSTGIIGRRLDVDVVKKGIDEIFKQGLYAVNGASCTEAIMTTDTFEKTAGVVLDISGKKVSICGISKGAGMIAPNMATLLAFITTDANIEKKLLDEITKYCVEKTFNLITVDGDMSTNDTLMVFANGMAENDIIKKGSKDAEVFRDALCEVMLKLAKDIVKDGEGATKFIEISVSGAKTESDAKEIALAIANSNLVKTAIFGQDPNWGRILSAAGSTKIKFNFEKVDLKINNYDIIKNGLPLLDKKSSWDNLMKKDEIKIMFDVKMGKKSATVYTSDLSYEYVKINAEYST